MKLIKSNNFPDYIANLIRHFEYQLYGETTLVWPEEIYGKGVAQEEWYGVIGKPIPSERLIVLTLDDGSTANAVSRQAMRSTGCHFVVFEKGWLRYSADVFAWRAIKAWPAILVESKRVHAGKHLSRIDVSPSNGNCRTVHL